MYILIALMNEGSILWHTLEAFVETEPKFQNEPCTG